MINSTIFLTKIYVSLQFIYQTTQHRIMLSPPNNQLSPSHFQFYPLHHQELYNFQTLIPLRGVLQLCRIHRNPIQSKLYHKSIYLLFSPTTMLFTPISFFSILLNLYYSNPLLPPTIFPYPQSSL